jgi:hypothetical protein
MGLDPALVKAHEALEEYVRSQQSPLDKAAETPAQAAVDHTASVDEPDSLTAFSQLDQLELREKMMGLSKSQLHAVIGAQAAKQGVGIPLAQWMHAGGNAQAIQAALNQNTPDALMLRKAMDSAGAGALIRQDLEAPLLALFVKRFPAFQRIRKIPANGLVHAWNKITDYGDAEFMPELGTVTDDNNTYERATTNIGILARRVGISLKAGFAVTAGGGGWNLEQTELEGGLTAIAHKMQKTIFQGNSTASGGTAADEDGEYDPNAFTGLRQILKNDAEDANVSDADPTNWDDMTSAVAAGVVTTTDAGATAPSIVYLRNSEFQKWNQQQMPLVRIVRDSAEFVPGIRVPAIATPAGDIPLAPVAGDSIGHYDLAGKDTADAYVLDEETIALPFLGSDSITTLDIPIGVAGQLVHYFIVFCMFGLEVRTNLFNRKIRFQLEA